MLEQFWEVQPSSKLVDRLPKVKKTGRGKGWPKGLGKNQLAQKQLVLDLEMGVAQISEGADPNSGRDLTLPDGKKRRRGRLPMVGSKRGRGEVKLRPGKQQRTIIEADAVHSTAPGVPRNLPLVGDPSDESQIKSDNDIGGLLGSASNSSPALQKAAQSDVNPLENERSNRFSELGQAFQELLKAKFLRKVENVTSGNCHLQSSAVTRIPSNVGSISASKKIHPGVRHSRDEGKRKISEATRSESTTETDPDLPQWARESRWKRDESEEEDDEDIPIAVNVLPERSKSAKSRERIRAQRPRNETEKLEKRGRPAFKRPRIHQQLQLLDHKKTDAKQIETRQCSSSEETESDREQPKQYRFVAGDATVRRMYTKPPVQRTIIEADAVHSTAPGVLRNLPLVGDPSDDSQIKSDNDIGGLLGSASNSSPALQKAAQSDVNPLKNERSNRFSELGQAFQELLKAKFLRKVENVTSGNCHLQSSAVTRIPSNEGSISASKKIHPGVRHSRDEGKRKISEGSKREVTFPLQIGALTIVSLGAVVRDSEHFHDQRYIWPEGYTSIRTFPSAKDPDAMVEYKLQVFRNPLSRSHPLFRVAPADDTPVEGPSPSACWQKTFQRLRKAHERVGKIYKLGVQFRSPAHMFGFSFRRVSKMIQSLPNARACTKFTNWSVTAPTDEDVEHVLPAGYRPVHISWKHLDRCSVCYVDEEYDGNVLLQCDKCRILMHMNCCGEVKYPDGDLWLCNLCRPEAPKTRPPCCLCPVTSGAMIKTTDGRWCHIVCAMWIPETYLVDGLEPVDGVNAVAKERWTLTCSICNVLYGACIRCSVNNCRTAFHPLCARSDGRYMEVLEENQKAYGEKELRFLAYCQKHKKRTHQTCGVVQPTPLSTTDELLPVNASGCARTGSFNAAARRGRRESEALAAALAKRLFVENLPHIVTGCRQISPPKAAGCSYGADSGEDVQILSTSEKFRIMKSSLSQRLVFGKSAIHGMGVFTKQMHWANDMMIEYLGGVIRPVIADLREERCYNSLVGAGTYLFRVDDERVVDATSAGNIAHLMNHSCDPNCYSRIVYASGKDRIIIFAKRIIEIGEELTYDYRFMSKDEVLTCHCGCVGCRGSVNVMDSDGDSNRLSVPLADLIKLPATTRGHTH